MKKRSLILMLVLLALVTGCGKTTNSSNTNEKENNSKEQQETKKQESKLKMGIYYDSTKNYYEERAKDSEITLEGYDGMFIMKFIAGPEFYNFKEDGTLIYHQPPGCGTDAGYYDASGTYEIYFENDIEYVKINEIPGQDAWTLKVVDENHLVYVDYDKKIKSNPYMNCDYIPKENLIYLED